MDNTGVAYEERVTPWRWQVAAETCRGNLMSTIKADITLEHLLVILHRKIQKCSVQLSRFSIIVSINCVFSPKRNFEISYHQFMTHRMKTFHYNHAYFWYGSDTSLLPGKLTFPYKNFPHFIKPKIHYSFYNSPPTVSLLSHIISIHASPYQF
jgi:hypothetical protein